jgi:hypothetical protein
MRTLPAAATTILAMLIGPGCGSSPTAPPPPAACTFQVTASGNSFGPGGGTTTVTISTASGCSWTASVNDAWVTLGSPSTGSGPGSVTVNVAPNTTTAARQCAVSVAGQSIALTQQGQAAACEFTLTPPYERFGASGGRRAFDVSTGAACGWTAASAVPWVAVTSGAGTGNGQVAYEVAAWDGAAERTGEIAVGPARFTVRQDPPGPVACDYSVSPVLFTPCMPATTMTATVTTQAGCSWTVAADASWIDLTSGGSGSGSGTITFRVGNNYDAPRQGLVKVRWPSPTAGQNLQVQQAGCTYAVSSSSLAFAAAGGAGRFDVIQQSDPYTCGGPLQDACVWTATADVSWITITSAMPRAGDDPVNFTVAANTTGAARTGTITVRDKIVRITQAGT